MNRTRLRRSLRRAAAVAVFAAAGATSSVPGAVRAQTNTLAPAAAPQTAPAPVAAAADPVVPVLSLKAVPAREVAARLSRATGAIIVTDHSTANQPVTLDLAPGPLSGALARVAEALPAGTVVKMALLPAPPPGAPASSLNGDQVAALIAAQENLYKPVVATTPAATTNAADTNAAVTGAPGGSAAPGGEVNILGRRLSADQAAPAVAALGLRPVYLLTNARLDDPVQKLSTAQFDALRQWMSLTPEQQKQAADQQFNTLMNMDPALRRQVFQQQMQTAGQFFQRVQALPPDQRSAFWRDVTGGRWDGTMPNRGAGGGGGNGSPFGGGGGGGQ